MGDGVGGDFGWNSGDCVKVGWEDKQLGVVCENLDSKRVPITKSKRLSGSIPYYGASGVVDHVADYLFDENLLLVSEDGANLLARTYPIAFAISGKTWVNNHAHVLRFEDMDSQQFIEYYLNFITLEPYVSGMAQPKLNQKSLNAIIVPFPPLPEQKRIVAILDEAFAGIDAAVANTEKNLANARELFEGYLNAMSFEKQPLGSLVEIKTGKLNANAAVGGGEYPFFTCSREVYEIDHYAFDCEAILLAGNNASGDFNVKHYNGKFNAYQRTYVITINDCNKLRYRFLYFQILKSLKELKSSSVGAGTKFLKLSMIKDLQIALPPIEEQQSILEALEGLLSESERLQKIYQQKLSALAELKQSILQKAFAGELITLSKTTLDEAVA
ncbi:MAG: restriction endonuclease subunit S [Thermodesulfobacteriota bacterium]|nr:restriction endonuclease subunit S [Thermodesulfobacteriota bacterium]